MPRTGRGGKRQGTPGQANSNRTDLNSALNQAAPAQGREFGAKQQDENAIAAVPVAPPPGTPPPPSPGPMPGESGPFTRPSERPDEPITTGLPMGAGAGPEILATSPKRMGASVLSSLADETGDPFLIELALRAQG